MGAASTTINMSLYQKLPYDTLRDFAPVILCIKGSNVLAVNPALKEAKQGEVRRRTLESSCAKKQSSTRK